MKSTLPLVAFLAFGGMAGCGELGGVLHDVASVAVIGEALAGDDDGTGITGENGEPGTDGSDGEQGTDGADGAAGEAGPMGEAGDTGPQGDVGAVGDTGPAGADGAAGPMGPSGEAGETRIIIIEITADGVIVNGERALVCITHGQQELCLPLTAATAHLREHPEDDLCEFPVCIIDE